MKKIKLLGLTIVLFIISITIVKAETIKDNGLGGVYIDIESMPQSHNGLKYAEDGCTWFVGGRVYQLTQKANWDSSGNLIVYGPNQWMPSTNTAGPAANTFGYGVGTEPIAPAVIVWSGHVAILEKIEGNKAYISEGGIGECWSNGQNWCSDAAHGNAKISEVNVSDISKHALDQYGNPQAFYGYVYLKAQWYSQLKLNDFGDMFYGKLIINKNWINTVNTGSSVTLGTKTEGTVNDVWIFRKQSDGSYTIQNAQTKLYLDVQNFNDYDGAPVNSAGYNGSNAQKWYIYGPGSGSYMLRPASSTDRVLTISGNIASGSKLVLSTHKDNDYQRFAIWTMNSVGKTTLSYNINTTTKLSWTAASDATKYNINIEKMNSNGTYETYKNIMGITGTSYTIALTKGSYSIAVMPTNGYSFTTSNVVKFTLSSNQVENNENILDNVTFNNSTVEYDGKSHSIYAKNVPSNVSVTYTNNGKTNAGTYTVTAEFKLNNKTLAKKNATLTINKKAVQKLSINGITNKIYTGKSISQNIVIKDGNNTLKNGTHYTITYKNNKYVGKATITITGKGNYTGSINKTFNINPKGTSIKKLTKGKKYFTVKWKKNTTQTTGYIIEYSNNNKFTNKKTIVISKNKTISKKITKLAKKTKYYVRVRTFKTVNNTQYYSNWSAVKTVTTK